MSELHGPSRGVFSVLDMIRKEFKSDTLKSFISSYALMGMALERKRVLEIVEMLASRRLGGEGEGEGL